MSLLTFLSFPGRPHTPSLQKTGVGLETVIYVAIIRILIRIAIRGQRSCEKMAAQAVRRLGRLTTSNCYFFLCDMQEKFRPSIRYFPEIIAVAQRMVYTVLTFDITTNCSALG